VTREPWPEGSAFDDGGLSVAGLRASDLAERYGTPLMVVDEDDVRARCREFVDAFGDPVFAIKSFPARAIIRIALQEGLGLLAATGGELEACLRAGADPGRIVMHGNNKSDDELTAAVEAGVRLLIADNPEELERADELARARGTVLPVLLRAIPAVDADTHAYIDTGGRDTKFGTPIEGGGALQALKLAESLSGLDLRGIHVHVGSQLVGPEAHLGGVDAALDLLAEARDALGRELPVLDAGGGFGVRYTDESPPTPAEFAAAIHARVADGATSRGLAEPALVVEPGRAIVANPVLTLYRVGTIKDLPGVRTYLSVDGGMSDNIRPVLYGSRYTFALGNRRGSERTREFAIAGKHCESGDVLAYDVPLPADATRGDLLAVAATGGYAYAMSSNYNRLGRPAVVGVRDGRARLLLRREDLADLDRLEVDQSPVPDAAPPEGVEIRPAGPADARGFLEFWAAIVAEGGNVRSESVTLDLKGQRRRFSDGWSPERASVVAVEGGRVIGFMGLDRETHPVLRHVADLGVSVAADRRGRGIGAALMARAFRWAREFGVEKITLSVYPDNRAAAALYARFGFVVEGRLSGQSKKAAGYTDEVLMARWVEERP
jgi:diaminopimelate decarboxylase